MVSQEIPSKRGVILTMPETLDLKNAAENAVSSYETRIESVGAMFDAAHQILGDFQEAFLDNKEEGRKINTELRDILAHNEHLRKKDFDSMTQGVLSAQEEREAEVKNLLKGYINQQKEMARALREDLAKFKDALAKGDVQRVKEFHEMIKGILADQDARKEEVSSRLKEFQKEQQEMAKGLKELLAKGRELRIKDLKLMLAEFKAQHEERIARQEERRKEVQNLLGEFKEERLKTAKELRIIQKKMAQRRTKSPKGINPNNLREREDSPLSHRVNIDVEKNGSEITQVKY